MLHRGYARVLNRFPADLSCARHGRLSRCAATGGEGATSAAAAQGCAHAIDIQNVRTRREARNGERQTAAGRPELLRAIRQSDWISVLTTLGWRKERANVGRKLPDIRRHLLYSSPLAKELIGDLEGG